MFNRLGLSVKIYTGNPDGKKIEICKRLGLGVMIATSSTVRTNKAWQGMSCALDNGAFRCWQRGYPFAEKAFLRQLDSCYENAIELDFIVCPDIVAGGKRSLDFSMKWLSGSLSSAPRVAFVVQDGMTTEDLEDEALLTRFPNITHIMVGGTEAWKWETVEQWYIYAHERQLKLHVGRCGTLKRLQISQAMGVDSVDSTSWARNQSWDILEQFLNPKQQKLILGRSNQ